MFLYFFKIAFIFTKVTFVDNFKAEHFLFGSSPIVYKIDYLTAHLNFHNVIMVILLALPYLIISFNGTNFARRFWRSLSNYFLIQNLRSSCNNIKINQNLNFFELVKSCCPFRFH